MMITFTLTAQVSREYDSKLDAVVRLCFCSSGECGVTISLQFFKHSRRSGVIVTVNVSTLGQIDLR